MGTVQLYQTVSFGSRFSDLQTVGYVIKDHLNNAAPRVTAGVHNLGNGQYGVLVEILDGFTGAIIWDTGGQNPVYASSELNAPDLGQAVSVIIDTIKNARFIIRPEVNVLGPSKINEEHCNKLLEIKQSISNPLMPKRV